MTDELPPSSRYRWLDGLPTRLVGPTVGNVVDDLMTRGRGVMALRTALLAGRAPNPDDLEWPADPTARRLLVAGLVDSGIVPFCTDDAGEADDTLLALLQAVDDGERLRVRAARADVTDADTEVLVAEHLRSRVRILAERADCLGRLLDAFDCLAQAARLKPGTERGMLRAMKRGELRAMQRVLDGLPQLAELAELLGRGIAGDSDQEPLAQRVGTMVARRVEVDAKAPARRGIEVRGIERSGEVGRMLPVEAAMLAHPILRRLWRVRWIEQSLLAYHAPGVHTNRIQATRRFDDGEGVLYERAERGPVVILFDTSGSMMGPPERTAKAAVFQIASVAFMERRPCFIYNFSGPDDVIEHELSFDGAGCRNVLEFLLGSFAGGTDLNAPLDKALSRLNERPWTQADLLVVSDGCFVPTPASLGRLAEARKSGALKVHGIAVEDGDGFRALGCDRELNLTPWSRRGPAAFSRTRLVTPYG